METETKNNSKIKPEMKPDPDDTSTRTGGVKNATGTGKTKPSGGAHNLSEAELKQMAMKLPSRQRRSFVRQCLVGRKDPDLLMAKMQKTTTKGKPELMHPRTEKQPVQKGGRQERQERRNPHNLPRVRGSDDKLRKTGPRYRPYPQGSVIPNTSWAQADNQRVNDDGQLLTAQCERLLSNISNMGRDSRPLELPCMSDRIGPLDILPSQLTSSNAAPVPLLSIPMEQEYQRFLGNINLLKTLKECSEDRTYGDQHVDWSRNLDCAPNQPAMNFDDMVELQRTLLEQEELASRSAKLLEEQESRSSHLNQPRRRSPTPPIPDSRLVGRNDLTNQSHLYERRHTRTPPRSWEDGESRVRTHSSSWRRSPRPSLPDSSPLPSLLDSSLIGRNDLTNVSHQDGQRLTRTPPRSWADGKSQERTNSSFRRRSPSPQFAGTSSLRRNERMDEFLPEERWRAERPDEVRDDHDGRHPRSSSPTAGSKLAHDSETPEAPLFIVPITYPSQRLSDEEMDEIENSILRAILDTDHGSTKPTFKESFRSHGRYGVICNDQFSERWLRRYITTYQLGRNACLRIIKAGPAKIIAIAELPLSKNDDNDVILKYIAKQNQNLDTLSWEVVQRWDGDRSTSVTFLIDEDSARQLKVNGKIHFKMGRAQMDVREDSLSKDDGLGLVHRGGVGPEQNFGVSGSGGRIPYSWGSKSGAQDCNTTERGYSRSEDFYSAERQTDVERSQVYLNQHDASFRNSLDMMDSNLDVLDRNRSSEYGNARNRGLPESVNDRCEYSVERSELVEQQLSTVEQQLLNLLQQQKDHSYQSNDAEHRGFGREYDRDQNRPSYTAIVPAAGGSRDTLRDRWTSSSRDRTDSHPQRSSGWSPTSGRDRSSLGPDRSNHLRRSGTARSPERDRSSLERASSHRQRPARSLPRNDHRSRY